MNKELAKKLSQLVDKRNNLSVYVEYRLELLRKNLEITSDINEIYKIQGQIKEVKRLLTLREEVEETLKY